MSFELDQYQCIVCFDPCKVPLSCSRCRRLICSHHLSKLANKCPFCRLEPYQYVREQKLGYHIEMQKQILKEKQKTEKDKIFECLANGCTYKGKLAQMLIHRKSRHFEYRINQILFEQDLSRKKKRDALQSLFQSLKNKNDYEKYHQTAMQMYIKARGRCQLKYIKQFLSHIDKCPHHQCKHIWIDDKYAYIGKEEGGQIKSSICPNAVRLRQEL